jgi:twitching motility protein PilT
MASADSVIDKILTIAAKKKASNIHLTVGSFPVLRIDEKLLELPDEAIVTDDFLRQLAESWLEISQMQELTKNKEIVFTKELNKKFRFKINFFFQKGFLSASLKVIYGKIPALLSLGLPKSVHSLPEKNSGLIAVCGPYDSGRSTTVNSIIEEINRKRNKNIIVIEKPIEYLFTNQKSIIEQREVGRDAISFAEAIRSAQQSDVDVISVGVNSEQEAVPLAVEFANSGRLAFIIMDATSSTQAIEEIISSFPVQEKERAGMLLADSLISIISQRLVPRRGGGLVLAAEVLLATEAVRSLIKEGKTKQLTTVLQSSREEGMVSMDQSLAELVLIHEVAVDKALEYASDKENFRSIARS